MVVSDHYSTFWRYLNLWYTVLLLCGEENHRFYNAMRRVAGEEDQRQGGGGRKSKAAKLYTPLKSGQTPSNDSHNLFVNPKRTWRAKQKAKIWLDDRLKLDTKILLSIFVSLLLTFRSSLEQIEQVTRGHNIVADGWAGASNPQPHPNPTPNHLYHNITHPQTHTKTTAELQYHKYMFFAFSTRAWWTDGWTNGETNGPTDQRTDKAS